MDKADKLLKIEAFFERKRQWKEEYNALRAIIQQFDLEEDYKWMHPCYTLKNKNVVLIHGFKEYVALLFHKGALIEDTYQMLIQQTENVQAARQLRFKSLEEIQAQETQVKYYIEQAIAIEKAGKKVEMKKTEEYELPVELEDKFKEDPKFEVAFKSLTPGRQRQYIYTISQAKRSATRQERVEKYYPQIMAGKGLND